MKFFKLYSFAIAALLFGAVIVSCSDDIFGDGRQLPAGSHPLKIIASVEEVRNRSAADPWIDGDSILITINNYPDSCSYALNSDGTIMGAKRMLDWTSERGDVKAWYPARPLTSIADQSEGLHAYDHMFALAENQYYKDLVHLTFKHQMAKVTCTLVQGEDLTDEEFKSIKVSFYGDTIAYFSDFGLIGENPGWISSWHNDKDKDEGYDASSSEFSALLVPAEISSKGLIKINADVTINGNPTPREYIYRPDSSPLEAGSHYRFVITVRRERIVVEQEFGIEDYWETPTGNIQDAVFRVNMPWALNKQAYKPDIVFTNFSENVRACDSEGETLSVENGLVPDDFDHLLVEGNDFEFTYTLQPDESSTSTHNETRAFLAEDDELYSFSRTSTFNGSSFTDADAYFEITQKMSLRTRTVNLTFDLYAEAGDFYYSDGTWLSELIDTPDKYCIGLVFHGGPGPEDNIDNYSIDPTFVDWKTDDDGNRIRKNKITGYVLALHDAKWANPYLTDEDYPYYNSNDVYQDDPYVLRQVRIYFKKDMGLDNTDDIIKIFKGHIDNNVYTGHYVCKTLYPRLIGSLGYKEYEIRTLPYQACLSYKDTWAGGSVSTPPGSSGWYLPSFRQIYDAFRLPDRKKKITDISNASNRIEDVSDFVINTDIDKSDSPLYNTISCKVSSSSSSSSNALEYNSSQYHMTFDPSPLNYWYKIIDDLDFTTPQVKTPPPTYTRPILTF